MNPGTPGGAPRSKKGEGPADTVIMWDRPDTPAEELRQSKTVKKLLDFILRPGEPEIATTNEELMDDIDALLERSSTVRDIEDLVAETASRLGVVPEGGSEIVPQDEKRRKYEAAGKVLIDGLQPAGVARGAAIEIHNAHVEDIEKNEERAKRVLLRVQLGSFPTTEAVRAANLSNLVDEMSVTFDSVGAFRQALEQAADGFEVPQGDKDPEEHTQAIERRRAIYKEQVIPSIVSMLAVIRPSRKLHR